MTDPKIVEYPTREALAEGLADLLAGRLRALLAKRGRASVAFGGGTTPAPMLARLGAASLGWPQVAVTLTDERWVSPSSPRSNQKLLADTLFRGAAAGAEFVPLYGGTAEPAQSLDAVATALKQIALPLDLAVLGMGDDMHTASLFPGSIGLDRALADDAPPVVAITAPGQPEKRVTLSAPVLRAAERHLMIAGADKRAALDRAMGADDPRTAPVLAVLEGATVHYAD